MYKHWLLLPLLLLLIVFNGNADTALRQKMLAHVEKIVVIDSLNVNREDFFKAYRIPASSGVLLSGEEVEDIIGDTPIPDFMEDGPYSGFTNEFQDFIIWAQPDTTGYLRIAESVRLGDGTWSSPRVASSVLNAGESVNPDLPVAANAAFPYMDSDGQSLYFASDNANSLGGFDIFVTYKDSSTGKYLIPRNLGMPFNSEYDDYMLVFDKLTGVGWWATERNELEDEITIYIYALPQSKETVDPEDENLEIYATLSGWETISDETTQALRDKYRDEIDRIKTVDLRVPDFELPAPDGRSYRYFSDFSNPKSESLMKRYLAERQKVADLEKDLSRLREEYYLSAAGSQFENEIKSKEKEIRNAYSNLDKMLSDLYKLEF